jgi:protein-S-isoprenylcysteine O-methyltransferase Ste14
LNYRELSGKARLPLGFVLAATFIVLAKPNAGLLPIGLAVGFLGLLLRAWAAGHIEKNRRLSTGGPYAFVRNPLYLGSFLLAMGFALVWHWGFVLLVIAFFVLVYAPTIQQERDSMASLFPTEYAEYAAHVPLFLPRVSPWRPSAETDGRPVGFSVGRYLGHAEWKAALGFTAGASWLLLRLKLGL